MRSNALTTVVLVAASVLAPTLASAAESAPASTSTAATAIDAAESARLAARVREEFLHAWRGYRAHAWGHDDLAPLSKKPHDWYAESLLMTPVDALDTMVIMGLTKEADDARELIAAKLDFDRDLYVKNFEITIRLLGGLLSGYQLTGDERLLAKAKDLGDRLLPAFDSPTGLPYVEVNLRTGKTRNPKTNPAETGTLIIEFGTLSKLTGDAKYYDAAKRALVETWKRRSKIGLLGSWISADTGEWLDRESHISGGIDSFYEYLWKCWRLFGDRDCKRMWDEAIAPANRYLADDVDDALWYGYANMDTGKRTQTYYGSLDAFMPAVLAIGGDLDRARRLQESSMRMWRLNDVEPETIDYRTMKVVHFGYNLRPEIIESAYYLHQLTGDARYVSEGREMFDDFVRCCRHDVGYAALANVESKEKKDRMESYVMAETFKYFYLLFKPDALKFDDVTFNTEAHPVRATWRKESSAIRPHSIAH